MPPSPPAHCIQASGRASGGRAAARRHRRHGRRLVDVKRDRRAVRLRVRDHLATAFHRDPIVLFAGEDQGRRGQREVTLRCGEVTDPERCWTRSSRRWRSRRLPGGLSFGDPDDG